MSARDFKGGVLTSLKGTTLSETLMFVVDGHLSFLSLLDADSLMAQLHSANFKDTRVSLHHLI